MREDPEKKGLLFAGTERQVWVSFDDGDRWQSLRLNMPATSIRDLVIHQDDVVVGTHGRSFWILDNITPLRQLDARGADAPARLFKPQLARRVRWNMNTDTPLPPEEPAGENPPDGAILDYTLKAASAGPVTLEILDASGKLVRRFSSADKPEPVEEKELNVPTYWIRPEPVPSGGAGFHRFVWDLHYPPPEALRHDYPMTAILRDTPRRPVGPWALPGTYSIRLTAGGTTETRPLTIEMDPRVRTSSADLARQFELSIGLCAAMREDYAAVQEVRALRAQVKTLAEKAGKGPAGEALAALDAKAAPLQGSAGGFEGGPGRGGAGDLSRLNGQLVALLEVLQEADAKPTPAAVSAVEELRKSLAGLLARWKELKTREVPAVNAELRKMGLPPIAIVEAAPPTR